MGQRPRRSRGVLEVGSDALTLDLADRRWEGLKGGYRRAYDPRPAIRTLVGGDATRAWTELWEELHHQGDIGEASYAAVVALADWAISARSADWNVYALAVTIEECRLQARNPPPPTWLAEAYQDALQKLFLAALAILPNAQSDELVSSVMAMLAIGKRKPLLARVALLTEAERQEMLDELGWA